MGGLRLTCTWGHLQQTYNTQSLKHTHANVLCLGKTFTRNRLSMPEAYLLFQLPPTLAVSLGSWYQDDEAGVTEHYGRVGKRGLFWPPR